MSHSNGSVMCTLSPAQCIKVVKAVTAAIRMRLSGDKAIANRAANAYQQYSTVVAIRMRLRGNKAIANRAANACQQNWTVAEAKLCTPRAVQRQTEQHCHS